MTVLELNDLVKACEEEFGVSAAAGVVVAAAGAGACLLYTSAIVKLFSIFPFNSPFLNKHPNNVIESCFRCA